MSTADGTAGLDSNIGGPYTTPVRRGDNDASAPDLGVVDLGLPTGPPPRMGFFTDTSICIGCKACEVACKEWNMVPPDSGPTGSNPADTDALRDMELLGSSYDNTGALGSTTWRHVAFIESHPPQAPEEVRWLMSSDVCKHCTHAACLYV